jgi:hypothetical protein
MCYDPLAAQNNSFSPKPLRSRRVNHTTPHHTTPHHTTKLAQRVRHLAFAIPLVILTACGGGGGDSPSAATTLSGTAAVGAPIVGATVNVTCAAGAALSNIPVTSATGAWSVTLSGQTLPCAVQVSGGTVNGVANTTAYQSIATSLGTVNVTPLSSLLVANLAGATTPNTWFANLTPAQLAAITSTQVSTSLTNLRTALNLTALNTIDPITLPFNPASGVVMDDILTALGSAMASNPALSYANLLVSAGASAGAAITPPVVLNAALITAFASTSSGGASGGTTGTAAQYFSKRAVGNTWIWYGVSQPGSFATTEIITITAATGSVSTITDSSTDGKGGANNSTRTLELDTAGAWVDSFGTVILPATFSVGNSWVSVPAMPSTGIGATISTIVAFNVTRTVPAGTFTDCLQVNSTQTVTTGSILTTTYTTRYYSPTAGDFVDSHSEISNGGSTTAQLQAGYIANSFTPTIITATANTTAQNLTVGTWTGYNFSPLTASGGTAPYTYSYMGTLPAGLSFNVSTGVVTGLPTATYPTADLVFSVKDVNNVTASTTSTVSFTIAAATRIDTAAYYFSKRAFGNTWTWNGVSQPGGNPSSEVMTIMADTGNAVTVSDTYTSGSTTYPPDTFTLQFGPLGELSATFGTYTALILPATFSVGTTWNSKPANLAPGDSAETSTVVAFNVTRTVPAGTFTDCLQVNSTQSHANGSVTTNTTTYYSPTAGLFVETLYAFSGRGTETVQLQAGYIANP